MEKELEMLTDGDIEDSRQIKKYGHWHIKMLPAKLSMFLCFGAKYVLMTYLGAFFVSTGMHPSQAGVILGTSYFVQTLGGAMLGWLADKTKQFQLITVVSVIGTIISCSVFSFIPQLVFSDSLVKNSTKASHGKFSHTTSLEYNNQAFTIIMKFCLIYNFFDGYLSSSVLSFSLSFCERFGKRQSYFWQRLWGTIGYTVCPFLVGVSLEPIGMTYISKYLPIAFINCVVSFFLIFPFGYLAKMQNRKETLADGNNVYPFVMRTLRQPMVILQFSLQLLLGFANAFEYSYFVLYMNASMKENGSMKISAFALLTQCVVEALATPLFGKVNAIVKEPIVFMIFGTFTYALVFYLYSIVDNGLYNIAGNALIGIAYCFFNLMNANEQNKIIPMQCKTFIFAINTGMYQGVGSGLGSAIGGYIYEELGPRNMYYVGAIGLAFVSLLLQITVFFKIMIRK